MKKLWKIAINISIKFYLVIFYLWGFLTFLPKVFWYFQWVQKWTLAWKGWENRIKSSKLPPWNFNRTWLGITNVLWFFNLLTSWRCQTKMLWNSSNIGLSFCISIISCVAETTHKFTYELRPYFFAYDISNPILPVIPL